MKKIVSIFVTVSLLCSSVPQNSFAASLNENVANSTFVNKLAKDYNLSWWGKKKVKSCLQDMNVAKELTQLTGDNYAENMVKARLMKILLPKEKGAFSRSLSWLRSSTFGQFLSAMLVSMAITKIKDKYYEFKTKLAAGTVEKAIDPQIAMAILDELLLDLKGQEDVKKQIRSIVLNIVDRNAQFAADPSKSSKKAGPGATILYMVGPSGVGKSFTAEMIRKVLNGFSAEPFVIEASDIDRQSSATPVEQLFGMRTKRVENGGGEINEYSPFIIRLQAIPNTVVLINEYDKMHTPELDEKLRTIVDQGYINVNGKKIDCSAVTFIITSNESIDSVTKGNQEKANVDDGTGSRTFINHDKSFLNRVKIIDFKNLSTSNYKEIAQKPFLQFVERCKEQYNVDIDLNGTIDEIAQRVSELNKGARPIFDYLDKLNDKVLNEVVLKKLSTHSLYASYKVMFDKDQDEFILQKLENVENLD